MTNTLFQNTVTTPVPADRLRTVLTQPEKLPLWNPAITGVTPDNADVLITRRPPALNVHERVSITTTAEQVIYQSTEGQLAYRLSFTLKQAAGLTTLTETLQVGETSPLRVPLGLLAPIAKQAFARNLQSLVAIAETLTLAD